MNCNRCGSQIESGFLSRSCPYCGAIIFPDTKDTAVNSNNQEQSKVNSEQQSDTNPLKSLFNTLTASFFDTNSFFKKVLNEKNVKPALLYGIVTGCFGLFALYMWSLIHFTFTDVNSTNPSSLIFAPLLIPIRFVFTAFYSKIILIIFNKNRTSFKTIFRIAAYSQGAAVLYAIPFLGSILYLIMWLYMFSAGLHHAISVGKLKILILLFTPIILISFFLAVVLSAFLAGNLLSSNQLSDFLNLIR